MNVSVIFSSQHNTDVNPCAETVIFQCLCKWLEDCITWNILKHQLPVMLGGGVTLMQAFSTIHQLSSLSYLVSTWSALSSGLAYPKVSTKLVTFLFSWSITDQELLFINMEKINVTFTFSKWILSQGDRPSHDVTRKYRIITLRLIMKDREQDCRIVILLYWHNTLRLDNMIMFLF